MKNYACLILLPLILATGAFAAEIPAAVPSPSPAAAIQLLQEIEQRFTSLHALRYQVVRSSQKGQQSQTERWIFTFLAPDRLRIDYQSPQERLILINADEMWEYIPSIRQALKTDLKPLAPTEKARRLATVMARVSIDGLHPGAIETFTGAVQTVTQVPGSNITWRIEGLHPRFTLTLDPQRKTLLSAEIYDSQDRLTLRTEASDWEEALPGFWFPRRIRAAYSIKSEFVTSEVQLDGVELNRTPAEPVFTFKPPEGVKVVFPGPSPKR
jgi:outer membrane lipoprotein-sorting protein